MATICRGDARPVILVLDDITPRSAEQQLRSAKRLSLRVAEALLVL